MKKEIHDFIESGLLDKYLIGETSNVESHKVEDFIAKYPEVKEEFEVLEVQLELAARSNAINPPASSLDSILARIDSETTIQLKKQRNIPYWFSIAASIAALIFAGSSILFYSQSRNLLDENNTIAEEIFDLRSDIENNNQKLTDIMRQVNKLNNPETQKYVLNGNERAKDLKTVAYINSKDKSSLIDVVSLPELTEQQCYQMWAELQDKMVNLGILDINDRKLKSVPYIEDAVSLSITIEPKGGNDVASLENAVAQILLNKNN